MTATTTTTTAMAGPCQSCRKTAEDPREDQAEDGEGQSEDPDEEVGHGKESKAGPNAQGVRLSEGENTERERVF